MGEQEAARDPWRLDPAHFLQRLDLELTRWIHEVLRAISEGTGKSTTEVAVEMLCREMHPHYPLRSSE
jgi:hypothetical protein